MSEETPKPPSGNTPQSNTKLLIRRWVLIIVGAVCAVYTIKYAVFRYFHETTDNAYITGHIHYIAPQITGVVKTVSVEDNDHVKAGELLVQIDPEPFDAALAEAQAKNERAQGDYMRDKGLASNRVLSFQDLAHAQDDAEAAEAELRIAELNRRYTTITSPVDGVVGGRNVETGNTVQPSINLLAVVEANPWVEANFKETQVAHIHVGQKVSMTVDAIPGKEFRGTVISIAPASGREFALLPADNATGNFTKIVQRLPVRIAFDADSVKGYADRLEPGLSVVANVEIR